MVMKFGARRSNFVIGISWTLLLLVGPVLFTSTFIMMGVSAAGEGDDTCETTATASSTTSPTPPHYHPQDDTLRLYHFDSTSSTQDEAKRIAEGTTNDDISSTATSSFCVTATEQTKGRGTNGRSWMGAKGNLFVTIGIRQQDWMTLLPSIPLTLLPLKIGSLVATHVQELLRTNKCHHSDHDALSVTVKWPNDVLVEERKISGVLIESSANGWLLIGIGVNVAYAPQVPTAGPNQGRPATSLYDMCEQSSSFSSSSSSSSTTTSNNNNNNFDARQLGVDLAYDLHTFLQTPNHPDADQILNDWKRWVDWDMELVMRDTPQQERVRLVGVLPDGRVQVQAVGQEDGVKRTLVSDYFL
jgi:biotin-(acetyl-CoA carboxylase) ligase